MRQASMRQAFVTATGVPFSNRALIESPMYAGGDALSLSCTAGRLNKKLFPSIWTIAINPDAPLVINNTSLQHIIETERRDRMQVLRLEAGLPDIADPDDPAEKSFRVVPMMNRDEHRTLYQAHRQKYKQSPYGFPFTLGVGGFVYIEREGEEHHNDPCQFVLQRTGPVDHGQWAPPSGLASANPLKEMCRKIAEETGIVVLDEVRKIATVVVPDFKVDGNEYDFFTKVTEGFDGMPLKERQAVTIRQALEREGKGDFRLEFKKFDTWLLTDNLPPQDKVTLTYPLDVGMDEHSFRAFVVKDGLGSVNIHLPFKIILPENAKLMTVDCQRLGRQTALKTQDELLALERHVDADGAARSLVTKVMSDLLGRPFKVCHIPKADPAPRVSRASAAPAPAPSAQ